MAAKTVADAAACCAACTAAEGCAAWVHRSHPKTKQVSPNASLGKLWPFGSGEQASLLGPHRTAG